MADQQKKSSRKRFLKIIVFIGLTAIVWGVSRKLLAPAGGPPPVIARNFEPSMFVAKGILLPSLWTYLILTLSLYATFFVLIQKHLPGRRLVKGLKYGMLFAILWLFGFLELAFFYDSSPAHELLSGIADGIPLVVSGILGGILWGNDHAITRVRMFQEAFVIPIVAVFFAIGHGVQYSLTFTAMSTPSVNAIHDGIDLIWLLSTGAWIGLMYYVFKPGLPFSSSTRNTLLFAVGVFGSNWALYNSFYLLFLTMPLIDLGIRIGCGIIAVALGILVFEMLMSRKREA